MTVPRENPFRMGDNWYWLDETGAWSKPHKSQRAALTDLLRYMKWLEEGPTLWQRSWWPIRYEWWPQFMLLCRRMLHS